MAVGCIGAFSIATKSIEQPTSFRPRRTDRFSIPKADTPPEVQNLIPFLSHAHSIMHSSTSVILILSHSHHFSLSPSSSIRLLLSNSLKIFKAVGRYWHFLFFETICPSGCGIFHWPKINFKWHLLCHSYLNVNNGTVLTSSTYRFSFAHNLSYLEDFNAFE